MPASTTYDVKIAMMLEDKATRGLSRMQGQLRRTQRETARMQRNLQSMSSGNLMAKAFGLGAGIFTIRKAASALFDFNKTIDMAQASFTGLLQMNMGGDMMTNFKRADRLVNMFIEDAKSSVASTDDFIRMGENIVGPATQVGASLTDIRELTKGAVTAAQAFGINANVASMDIQQAIQGRMTLRDRLPKLLGLDPESWNVMARKNPQEALSKLKSILGQSALKNMAEMQANTFTGQWRKLQDNLTITLGKVGRPLMKAMADEFSRISKWVDANPDKVNAFTRELASALTTAFSAMRSAMSFLWRNREMLLLVAKAFLAFKAVKGVTNLVGGVMGNILQFSNSLTGANAGLNTFGSKLGALGSRLGLLGAAALGVYEGSKHLVDKLSQGSMGDAYKIGSVAENIQKQQIADLAKAKGITSAEAEGMISGTTTEATQLMSGRANTSQALLDKMGVDSSSGVGIAQLRSLQSQLHGGFSQFDFTAIEQAAEREYQRQNDLLSAEQVKADVAKMGIQDLLDLTKQFKESASGAALAYQLQNSLQNSLLSTEQGKTDAEKMGMQNLLDLTKQFKEAASGAALEGESVANAIWLMKSLLSGSKDAGLDKPGQGMPGGPRNNINVQMKVEVKSDDPDRFVMDLGKAFEMAVKSPSSAFATFREG